MLPKNKGSRKDISGDKKRALFDNYILGTIKEYFRQIADDEKEIDKYIKEARKFFTD